MQEHSNSSCDVTSRERRVVLNRGMKDFVMREHAMKFFINERYIRLLNLSISKNKYVHIESGYVPS
jgi:hypothetical protein